MSHARHWVRALAIGSFSAITAGAQQSLADALRVADRAAYGNRMAAAATQAAEAQRLAPLKGVLPSVRIEAGYVRTTDPIGTFGSTLRQRAITQSDFAPDRLNYPDAVGNYQGGVVIEQPLFNADAWVGRQATTRAADANRAQEDWTRLSTRADVVRAWFGVILATEQVRTLGAASRAGHAHVAQAEAMVRQGLVTKSDALLAAVRAGELDAQLAEATANAAIARRQFALLLGHDGTSVSDIGPSENALLPASDRLRTEVASDTVDLSPGPRADVRAADQALMAARDDALRARSAYLPRINSFARYDWNSRGRLYAGDKNWTVGVVASWSVFTSATDASELRATESRAAGARAAADAAAAHARLEQESTRSALAVALNRLTIAEQGSRQSAEAHRIVARKYDGGLASVVELLDAQATETGSALALANARYAVISAAADRRRALGRDPGALATLDQGAGVAQIDTTFPMPNADQPAR